VEIEHGLTLFLDPRDQVPVNILRSGEWQPEIWTSISAALPKDGVFFDVGAHIGYYSVKAARRVGPGGRVLPFEPSPELVRLLRDTVESNRLPQIDVVPTACADRDQMLPFTRRRETIPARLHWPKLTPAGTPSRIRFAHGRSTTSPASCV